MSSIDWDACAPQTDEHLLADDWVVDAPFAEGEATAQQKLDAIAYVCSLDLEHNEYQAVLQQIVIEDQVEWDSVACVGPDGGDS